MYTLDKTNNPEETVPLMAVASLLKTGNPPKIQIRPVNAGSISALHQAPASIPPISYQ
jgi:hypothetical protein